MNSSFSGSGAAAAVASLQGAADGVEGPVDLHGRSTGGWLLPPKIETAGLFTPLGPAGSEPDRT